jgi:uncharacterized protein YgiM (DUF1202 family)
MNRRLFSDLTRLIVLTILLGQACSCSTTPVITTPGNPFFLTPEITYLLDSPGYGGSVLGPLYRGDKVEVIDAGDSAWWRITIQRSGQTGWVRKELLSPDPVATVFYLVKAETLRLRECPRDDCPPLQVLFRGDRVQRVEAGDQGWWRVLALNSGSLGWLPAAALTERLEDAQLKELPKPYYYVAARKLALRAKPSNRAEIIRTLGLNDQVEKIGEAEGWFNVRQPASGAVGWVNSRDLETLPFISPRGAPPRKPPAPPQKAAPAVEPDFL